MEICLFGGVFFFEYEQLTVTVFSHPEIDINGTTTYLVSDEKALSVYPQLAQWFDNDEEVSSVVTILSRCLRWKCSKDPHPLRYLKDFAARDSTFVVPKHCLKIVILHFLLED